MQTKNSGWIGYDWFKLLVAILLILLLLFFRAPGSGTVEAPTDTPLPPTDAAPPTEVPPPPTVAPPPPAAPSVGSPASGSSFPIGPVAFNGSSAPDASIQIMEGSTVLNSTQADGSGNWALDVPFDEAGKHTVFAHSDAGVSDPVQLTITAPEASYSTPRVATPVSGSSFPPGVVIFAGTADANAPVTLSSGGVLFGETQADTNGVWSLNVDMQMPGTYDVSAASGESRGDAINITITAPPPLEPTPIPPEDNMLNKGCGTGKIRGGKYEVAYCETLTKIAERLDIDLAALIAANPDVVNPNLIYPGQLLNLP